MEEAFFFILLNQKYVFIHPLLLSFPRKLRNFLKVISFLKKTDSLSFGRHDYLVRTKQDKPSHPLHSTHVITANFVNFQSNCYVRFLPNNKSFMVLTYCMLFFFIRICHKHEFFLSIKSLEHSKNIKFLKLKNTHSMEMLFWFF